MAGTREVTTTGTNRIVGRCISRGRPEERKEEIGKQDRKIIDRKMCHFYVSHFSVFSLLCLRAPEAVVAADAGGQMGLGGQRDRHAEFGGFGSDAAAREARVGAVEGIVNLAHLAAHFSYSQVVAP